jgi:tripartite-type tricarboxylate transporter receptor subunit TctC
MSRRIPMRRSGRALGWVAALVLVGALSTAHAADPFPDRALRLVVPYPPGAGTDIVARLIGQELTASWGQAVVVDNRPGAGGTIGSQTVARARPDGYTLLMADVGPLAIAPSLYAGLPYDPAKDFAAVTQVAIVPLLLVINPSVPANNLADLIALAKSTPGKLAIASIGNGSASQVTAELFKRTAGIEAVHVPYGGASPALTDLVSGQVAMMFVNALSALPLAKAGQLRAIAITTLHRSPVMPDIPTIDEAGLPGFVSGLWYGILAPAGTPSDVVGKLNAELIRILRLPDVVARLSSQGAEPIGDTPEQFAVQIQREIAKWAPVVKAAGIHVD